MRPAVAQELHEQIRELVWQEPDLSCDAIGESSEGKQLRDELRAEFVDDDEGVLAVLLRGVVAVAVQVLARDR